MLVKKIIKSILRRARGFLKNDQPVKEVSSKDYLGEKYIYRDQSGADIIAEMLRKDEPCLVARYGTTELLVLSHYEKNKSQGNCSFPATIKSEISDLSGFFPPTDRNLIRFCHEFIDSIQAVDVMGIRWECFDKCFWDNEEVSTQKFCGKAKLVGIEQIIAPFFNFRPWMKELEGKKVLVVHPFENTIRSQYERREKLFLNSDCLPDFQLKTLKAVQSLADEKESVPFSDWFEALAFMCKEIDKIDYDVAIIGAGAFGIFLGAHCKKMGKKAVHMGGATQVLFGIKGKRWVERGTPDSLAHIINDFWVYPAESEKPRGAERVENSCYW